MMTHLSLFREAATNLFRIAPKASGRRRRVDGPQRELSLSYSWKLSQLRERFLARLRASPARVKEAGHASPLAKETGSHKPYVNHIAIMADSPCREVSTTLPRTEN